MVISHELTSFNSFVTYLPLVSGGWVLSAKIAMRPDYGRFASSPPTRVRGVVVAVGGSGG